MRKFSWHVASTTGISVLQQFVGLGRHVLIAACFGISREFDSYLVMLSLATIVVFNLSLVFDTICVSHLNQIREHEGEEVFLRTGNRLLLQSAFAGLGFAALLVLMTRATMPIFGAGFSTDERDFVLELSLYFMPWIALILPYYAVSAQLKAKWHFQWVFGAELLAMLVSILVLILWHDTVHSLPLAYAAGYAAAFLILLWRSSSLYAGLGSSLRGLMPRMVHQYGANQMSIGQTVIDRYFQSHLPSGGISALSYAGQITNNLSTLLTFRDIYVVPLSTPEGREAKLERVLKGIVLLSIPSAAFIIAFSAQIVPILFQRGQFDAAAASLTATVLQILALSLISSTLYAPLGRMLQILHRLKYTYVSYIVSMISLLALEYLFVFHLRWETAGLTWAVVGNSFVLTLVTAILLQRSGVVTRWHHVAGYGLYAAVSAAVAGYIAVTVAAQFTSLLTMLVAGGVVFGAVVAGFYLAIYRRLKAIAGLA